MLLVGAQRIVAGLVLVAAILLYRGTYAAPDDPSSGLAGLGLTVAAAGAGLLLAALVFPSVVTRTSLATAVGALLLGAAAVQAVFAAVGSEVWLVATAFALGLSGHALKIAADTLVQQQVSDDHRGRVFSIYDVVFNAGLTSAAVLGALTLPVDGDSPQTMGLTAVALAGLAAIAARVLPGRAVGAPARG